MNGSEPANKEDELIASNDFECSGFEASEKGIRRMSILENRAIIAFRDAFRSGIIRVICPRIDKNGFCHPRDMSAESETKCPYKSIGV